LFSVAVRLAGSYVIPVLIKRGYIKSFEKEGTQTPLIKNSLIKNNRETVIIQVALTKESEENAEVDTAD